MKQFFKLISYSLILTIALSLIYPSIELLHIFVYALNLNCFYQLVNKLGVKIVFMEFIAFSAMTFWLTVPLIIFDLNLDRYAIPNLYGSEILAIEKYSYFEWALPATLALIFGLYFNKTDKTIFSINLSVYIKSLPKNIPIILFILGSVSSFIIQYLPGYIGFIFYLFSQLTFISVLYCLFGDYSFSKWIYLGTFLLVIIRVSAYGMFGEVVWWGLIIIVFLLLRVKWSFFKKLLLIILSIVGINTLQIVKELYRAKTWNENENAGIISLSKSFLKSFEGSAESKSIAASYTLLYRLNHAYTVSRVMQHVPKKEPFAKGETIFISLAASFVPRLLWLNKPKSGGIENIKRFANHIPNRGSSYDIGQIGDAWANFGFYGGILFLFLYGFFNSWLLKILINFSYRFYPTLLIWIPIIFIQLLKVEVSVVTNFNAAIKGAIFIFLFYLLSKKINFRI